MKSFRFVISRFGLAFLGLAVFYMALLAGCIANEPLEKDVIARIGDAENILFTDTGRLFVTGAYGVYEISQDAAEHYVADVYFSAESECSFTGLAQIDDWLFTACMGPEEKALFAISLSDNSQFSVLDPLEDLVIPNGIAAIPQRNELLIADENFLGQGGISKAEIDFSGPLPVLAAFQSEWIGAAQGVRVSNGVKVKGDYIYLTDYGKLQRVYVDPKDGPQTAETLYETGSVLDDLTLYCDGALIADFI